MNDAVGGHIDLIIGSAALLAAQIEAGTLRPLMQSGATRAPTLKNVPTIAESGFAGSEAYAWWGVFVRAGTPAAIKDRIFADLRAALDEPSMRSKLETTQQVKLELSGAKEFGAFFETQMKVWGDVVKENGIKPD